MEARRLVMLLRGDLDWVVMKCLEKDRTRRYETANGLALDIERHLNNEPITARPPSSTYRFWKLVRRNKLGFVAAAAVLLALLLGIIATSLGLSWALRERAVAESRNEEQETTAKELADRQCAGCGNDNEPSRAERVTPPRPRPHPAARKCCPARYGEHMLADVRPNVFKGMDTKASADCSGSNRRHIDWPTSLKGQPEVEADLRQTLGKVYADLDDLMRQPRGDVRRGFCSCAETLGDESLATAEAMDDYANSLDISNKTRRRTGDGPRVGHWRCAPKAAGRKENLAVATSLQTLGARSCAGNGRSKKPGG